MPADIFFQHPDWSPTSNVPKNCECGWADKDGLVIVLNRIGPDKPLRDCLGDANAARNHYRAGFAKNGIGLIECDTFELDGVAAARAIGKALLKPSGAVYVATIAVPLPKESYVFNVMARESGITGMRETAVMMRMMGDLEKKGYVLDVAAQQQPGSEAGKPISWKNTSTGAVLRWVQDPYDPNWIGPCMRNLADAPEHDTAFPQHPLSRVRVALRCLAEGVRLSDDIKRRAAGKKRWGFR
jgi:hypothetical protein